MATKILVPSMGESITEATIAKWIKQIGEPVEADEPVVELETDKVTLEVPAPVSGRLESIAAKAGQTVEIGALLGSIAEGEKGTAAQSKKPAAEAAAATASAPSAAATAAAKSKAADIQSPAVRKIAAERGIDTTQMTGSGKGGRVTKGDLLAPAAAESKPALAPAARSAVAAAASAGAREERVVMSRLRRRIAERLKAAQNTAAILTTFNEVDMTAIMEARERFRDSFEKKHGVKLGFMSFFVKAAMAALKEFPAVNAEIAGDEVIYKNYYDIGVAVGTDQGLVVPVLRNADQMGFADIELKISELGKKARDGKLTIEDLTGGTFTISNGGIYGSLLSTPILNPPQSGILGMHKIQKRPMVIGDKIEIRPMMYLALSYDHRIIDGKEAVSFLVRIKDSLEDPQRLLFEI